jgi:hypothetical protein
MAISMQLLPRKLSRLLGARNASHFVTLVGLVVGAIEQPMSCPSAYLKVMTNITETIRPFSNVCRTCQGQ